MLGYLFDPIHNSKCDPTNHIKQLKSICNQQVKLTRK